MREKIYVFGFDNTLVNSEDMFVEAYNKVFHINITMEHWNVNYGLSNMPRLK